LGTIQKDKPETMKKISLTILITITMFNLFGQGTKSKVDKEFKKISSKIYCVIKVEVADDKDADFEVQGDDQPVFKKIAGNLLCFYGVDKGSHFDLLLQRDLPENVGTDELDQYSHDNLLNYISDKTQIHQTPFGGVGFSCGGDHEAALLTLPEIWNMVVERLGEEIVFAVPSKDLIIFVSADKQESIDGLENMVEEVHKDGERLLSKQLFTYKDGKVEVKK